MAETTVHPTAIIDPSACLGQGVTIAPYAVIGPDVELGDRVSVGPHAVVEHATVGNDSRIFPHAFVGTEPQDLKFKGEKTRVRVGSRTTVRECVTVHRGTSASGLTSVGDDCLLMAYVHVAHDCVVGNNVIMANVATLAGHVHVGVGAFIGGLTAVHQFSRIGVGAMIGGGSMVPTDVPPFCMVQGDRAKIVGLNVVGLRRRGTSKEALSALKFAYHTLYSSGLSLADAVSKIAGAPSFPETDLFLDFLRHLSPRGLCRPASKVADTEGKDFF